MTRDFFEIEPDDLDAVRAIALRTLTDVAGAGGKRFTVVARDRAGHPVLAAPLTLTAKWLRRGEGRA